jgi:predicted N-acetyltransferase YhbS
MEVLDLRDAPQHFGTVADRIWNAWWKPDGLSLEAVNDALTEVTASEGFPVTLVAVEGEAFLGTVTCIFSDIAERPEIGPCVAALWVESEARGENIGVALARTVLGRLAAAGFEVAYLSARQRMRQYYLKNGWQLFEENVGAEGLDVFRKPVASC